MSRLKRWKINRLTKKIKAMQLQRVTSQPSDAALKREILYYFELAAIYRRLFSNKKFPHAEVMYIECYRAAANLDDSSAHFQLANLFVEEAKFRQNLQQEGVFASPGNQKRYEQLYAEAHAHLIAAERLGHSVAKRLRGLCLINGWGVSVDKDAGFELIVASIDQEGSWDKVPQIFASMGLNKPEFFAAIMQRRKGA